MSIIFMTDKNKNEKHKNDFSNIVIRLKLRFSSYLFRSFYDKLFYFIIYIITCKNSFININFLKLLV